MNLNGFAHRSAFDARLSALIDQAVVELENSPDPAVAAKWRRVCDALVDGIAA